MSLNNIKATVLCCICGVKIAPNPLMRCLRCLQVHYNITKDIHKEVIIHFCKGCDRFLDPPSQWVSLSLYSLVCFEKICP